MSAIFTQDEINIRERLNELETAMVKIAENSKALLPLQAYAGRNLLINGDFSVWQRGDGPHVIAGIETYTADRFYAVKSTIDKVAVGNTFGVKLSNVIDSYAYIGQKIENCVWLSGKTVTLSFDLSDPVPTGEEYITFKFDSGAIARIYNGKEMAFAGHKEFTITLPDDAVANDNLTISINTNQATVDGGFTISNMQLELGSEATEFEQVDPATQLAKCQRYYQKLFFSAFSMQGVFRGGISLVARSSRLILPVEMRVQPTSTGTTGGCAINSINDGAVITPSAGSLEGEVNGADFKMFNLVAGHANIANSVGYYVLTGSTSLTVELDAEL